MSVLEIPISITCMSKLLLTAKCCLSNCFSVVNVSRIRDALLVIWTHTSFMYTTFYTKIYLIKQIELFITFSILILQLLWSCIFVLFYETNLSTIRNEVYGNLPWQLYPNYSIKCKQIFSHLSLSSISNLILFTARLFLLHYIIILSNILAITARRWRQTQVNIFCFVAR